jgi:hypothetical protein
MNIHSFLDIPKVVRSWSQDQRRKKEGTGLSVVGLVFRLPECGPALPQVWIQGNEAGLISSEAFYR